MREIFIIVFEVSQTTKPPSFLSSQYTDSDSIIPYTVLEDLKLPLFFSSHLQIPRQYERAVGCLQPSQRSRRVSIEKPPCLRVLIRPLPD